ncbi:hypothetical protein KM043_012460 [Ampulex compressa]|nr:hypothetical protein KM043_012460 [Ampulex compressa]
MEDTEDRRDLPRGGSKAARAPWPRFPRWPGARFSSSARKGNRARNYGSREKAGDALFATARPVGAKEEGGLEGEGWRKEARAERDGGQRAQRSEECRAGKGESAKRKTVARG